MEDEIDPLPARSAEHSGNRRCRSYSVAYKLSILKEISRPGASVAGVARANDLNANMVFEWRRLYRQGKLAARSARPVDDFVPVRVSDEAAAARPPALPRANRGAQIEIALPNGICVRTDADIADQSLRRILLTAGTLP